MDKQENKSWQVVAGLILAVLGVVSPIVWDLFRNSSALELRHTTRTTIIRRNENLDKLSVHYDGRPVKELVSLRFSLANTGSKPIREADLVAPPTIRFADSTPILDARIEHTYPSNLAAVMKVAQKPPGVSVTFPLLNPGDNLQFSVLIGDSAATKFEADARIVGVPDMKVVTHAEEPSRAVRHGSWTAYFVGGLGVCLGLIGMIGATDVPKERRLKKLLLQNEFHLPPGLTRDTAIPYVSTQLSWTTRAERSAVLVFLQSLPADRVLAPDEIDNTERLMRECSAAATPNLVMVIVVWTLAALGLTYAAVQLLF